MLTPEYLATFMQEYLGYTDILNQEICKDMARRIMKTATVTDTARWQAQMAAENGLLQEDVAAEVGKYTTYSNKEIMSLFKEAGLKSIKSDAQPLVAAGLAKSPSLSGNVLKQLLANAEKCQGEAGNLTLTTAVNASENYMNALNMATMKVQSGAFSPQQAIRAAIRQTAQEGARVQYQSRTFSLDAAINMCVRTSIAQTCATMTEQYSKEMGAEYYETSAHNDARETHIPWQGRVFQIDGSSLGYENFYEATGYGDPGGLCGVNCRHSFFPYWPGISVPAYSRSKLDELANERTTYNGQEYSAYEASQMQREMERNIRATKRELAAYNAAIEEATDEETEGALKEAFTASSQKLKAQNTKLKDFCQQTGRTNQTARTQVHAAWDTNGNVVYYGHSTASKATAAAKKATT